MQSLYGRKKVGLRLPCPGARGQGPGARGQAGFGSKLVHTSLTSQLGGFITFQWPAEGAIVTLRVSKALLGT